MLQTVMFEPPVDIFDNGDVRHPSFLFNYNGARKSGTLMEMRFTGWVYDMMLKEADNERDVWSDTTAIAADIIQYIDDRDRVWQLIDGVDIQALSHETGDLLSGVRFDFTLQMPMPSACLVPEAADGVLITEDGRIITTQDGRAIALDTATGTLIYAETGEQLITEGGQTLILQ